MTFQTLKQRNKSKYVITSIIVIIIVVTITFMTTRANWKNTSSIQLATGTINYSPSDFELVSIKLQDGLGEYKDTDIVPTSGYELNAEKTVCKIKEEVQDITITYENGKINISNINKKGIKCEVYFDRKICPDGATTCEFILANNVIDNSRSSGHFESAYEEDTAGRIFSGEDDDGETYFFAGTNPNNWVQFGGFYWRIVRINGNGSIRLAYNGTSPAQEGDTTQIGTSAFNTSYNDNAYVGYMYGTVGSSTYAETHTNTNSSTIKIVLDNWYEENLKENYEQYIDTNVGFCGDRTVDDFEDGYTGDGTLRTRTQYAPYKRAWSTYTATYKCSNNNDYYTVRTSNKGNKALTYPIGLITIDEVMYAGGYTYGTQNHWLKTGNTYWTMSPNNFNGNYAYMQLVNNVGYLNNRLDSVYGVRPVINLRSDIQLSGTGITSDPYVIIK